jgi:hypothetical protein
MLRGSRGDYPYNEGKHVLAMMELYTYCDESGIEDSATYCLIVGFVATPRQWKALKADWAKALKTFGVPVFHAKDFFPPARRRHVECYGNWSDKKAEAFLNSLLDTITKRQITTVAVALEVEGFWAQTEETRRLVTGDLTLSEQRDDGLIHTRLIRSGAPKRPYAATFKLFIDSMLSFMPQDALLHFYFDRQEIFEFHAVEQFNYMAKYYARDGTGGERLGTIAYAGKEKEIALQAADLNAYLWNSSLTMGDNMPELRASALERIKKRRWYFRRYDKEHWDVYLRRNMEIFESHLLQSAIEGIENPPTS